MNTGKIVRNAGTHRILYSLSLGVKTGKELKQSVGSINGVARFEGEYMARLLNGGYAKRVPNGWAITKAGEEKLAELGPVSGIPKVKMYESPIHRPVYEPTKEHKTPMRPGSQDHLVLPSRMGDKLIYRDGTVKEIKRGH